MFCWRRVAKFENWWTQKVAPNDSSLFMFLFFEDEKIDGYKKLHLYRLNSSAGGMFSLKPEIMDVIFSSESVATFCFVSLKK